MKHWLMQGIWPARPCPACHAPMGVQPSHTGSAMWRCAPCTQWWMASDGSTWVVCLLAGTMPWWLEHALRDGAVKTGLMWTVIGLFMGQRLGLLDRWAGVRAAQAGDAGRDPAGHARVWLFAALAAGGGLCVHWAGFAGAFSLFAMSAVFLLMAVNRWLRAGPDVGGSDGHQA